MEDLPKAGEHATNSRERAGTTGVLGRNDSKMLNARFVSINIKNLWQLIKKRQKPWKLIQRTRMKLKWNISETSTRLFVAYISDKWLTLRCSKKGCISLTPFMVIWLKKCTNFMLWGEEAWQTIMLPKSLLERLLPSHNTNFHMRLNLTSKIKSKLITSHSCSTNWMISIQLLNSEKCRSRCLKNSNSTRRELKPDLSTVASSKTFTTEECKPDVKRTVSEALAGLIEETEADLELRT